MKPLRKGDWKGRHSSRVGKERGVGKGQIEGWGKHAMIWTNVLLGRVYGRVTLKAWGVGTAGNILKVREDVKKK